MDTRMLMDLHIHSSFSDGKLTIPELVDLYGSLGFGVIAITDHLCEQKSFLGKAAAYLGHTLTQDNFSLYLDTIEKEAERAARKYGMLVLPGFELTRNSISNHRSSHILAIGVNRWIDASQSVEGICDEIRSLGGLAVAAHPVSTQVLEKQTFALWNRREELAGYFDAWEVASGKKLFQEVYRSGLPQLANSDLHRAEQIESWKTLLLDEPSELPRGRGGTSIIDFKRVVRAVREQRIGFEYFKEGVRYGDGVCQSRFTRGRNSSVDLRLRARLA